MSLVPFNMDNFFNLPVGFNASFPLQMGRYAPPMDVFEDENQITVSADLPGLTKDQINIELKNNKLRIKGENKMEKEFQDAGWRVKERYFGTFDRHVTLPDEVDHEKVQATFKNGVLQVVVPKKYASEQAKHISVQ
jgi:HSP20 family protein